MVVYKIVAADEWREAIVAEVGAHGQRIGRPNRIVSEICGGIGGGSRADVVSFGIDDDKQFVSSRIPDNYRQCVHACRPVLFEECHLWFDSWN